MAPGVAPLHNGQILSTLWNASIVGLPRLALRPELGYGRMRTPEEIDVREYERVVPVAF